MAVTLSKEQLAVQVRGLHLPTVRGQPPGYDVQAAGRMLAVATGQVLRAAPDAPDAAHNEAVLRLTAYLAGGQRWAAVAEESSEDTTRKYRAPSLDSALRASGAQACLSPWIAHRALRV